MDYKLFVGNIPFDCNIDEFRNAFKTCKGYITADLINENTSRCFGFVVLKDNLSLENLLNNNILIRDRKLRLTRYNEKIKEQHNYIKLENIPTSITKEDIRTEFENYSKIGKCFIEMDRLTGKYKTSGIVEIIETDVYEQLLTLDTILINDKPINMSRYNKVTITNQVVKNEHRY